MAIELIDPKTLCTTMRDGSPGALATAGRLDDGGGLALLRWYKGNPEQHNWAYRFTWEGKPAEMSLGPLRKCNLARARKLRKEADDEIAAGRDPRKARKDKRAADTQAIDDDRRARLGLPVDGSVKDWTLRYIEVQRASWGSPVETESEWLGPVKLDDKGHRVYGGQMGKHVFPVIGDKKIAECEKEELVKLFLQIMANAAAHTRGKVGKKGTAAMVATCKKLEAVFGYAVASEHMPRNVMAGIRKLLPKHRGGNNPAVKTAEGLHPILLAFDNSGSRQIMKTAMQVQVYLFQRSDISTEMEWTEVNLKRALWTVPASKMKFDAEEKDTGEAHEIYLPRQVVALLEALQPITGAGRYVFPNEKTPDGSRPMDETSLNNAMQAAQGKRRGKVWTTIQTAHGFRTVGITCGPKYVELYGAPLVKEVMDVIAGHRQGDALGQAYMRDDFGDRRPRYAQAFADWIDAVRAGDAWAFQTVTERKAQAWEEQQRQAANAPTVDPAQWEAFLAWQAATARQAA